jgi:hypothetical protein
MTTTPRTCVIDRDELTGDVADVADVADVVELDAVALDDELAPAPLTAIELGAEIVLSGASMVVDSLTSGEWEALASDAAEACIARFADAEADVASSDLAGLGRTSGVRFPRLGGALYGRIVPGSAAEAILRDAIERTIRAGYHTALAMQQVTRVPVLHEDEDELWAAFAPESYRLPRRVAAMTWEICRFDDFWIGVLEELGLEGDAVRFAKGHVSALSRSIRGLSTVGLALALAERGGRHDRLQSGRPRPFRAHRRAGRAMPRAPRPAHAG